MRRALVLAVALFVAAVTTACGSQTPSSQTPSGAASLTPPGSGSGPSAPPTTCPIPGLTGRLPSNRLIDIAVASGDAADRVSFIFGSQVSSPAGDPMGQIARAEPPFSSAGSGAPIDVAGTRFLDIRFSGMVIAGEDGGPTFVGRHDQEVEFPALRQVTLYDESEGVVGWYVGFDGLGCATLTFDAGGSAVQLEIAHG